MSLKERRAEQSEQTIARLVEVATALFVKKGYAKVTIGELSKAAKMTSGAIYHHFEDKLALFERVAETITEELVAKAQSKLSAHADPWLRLCAGIDAVLEASGTPKVKLAFIEAPAVLGLDKWRRIEQQKTAPLLQASLEGLVRSGALTVERATLLAPTLRGMIVEAAMAVAESKTPEKVRPELSKMIQTMVLSLSRPPAP
ncbi:MAG: TetR/AcrR family transcriptional regulator [Myxococcaceae bacterium]